MSTANYRYGATTKREYTPAADQVAGDVVVLDDGRIGVVSGGISAGKLGEVFIDGVFDITSATGTTASEGDAAFIDVSDGNNVIPAASAGGSDVPLGVFMADKASGELVARVDLNAAAIDNSVDEAAEVTLASVQTLTNKRIVPRVVALADAATITPNADTTDIGSVAALSQTTDVANPTGTPTDGQRLELRVTTGTSRSLTYGTQFRSTVGFTLPTATLGGGATERLVFEWIATASKWDLVNYDSQAAAVGGGGGLFGSRTLVVSEDGDDTAAALAPYAAEFETVEAASAAAAVGDLVVLRSGAYTENPGAGNSVVKSGVNVLCFPGVTINLTSGSWLDDGGAAGEAKHDLLGHPTLNLSDGTLILKRSGSGAGKGRYEIREITGQGGGFNNLGAGMDLDIDLTFDAALYWDFATGFYDPAIGHGTGLVYDNGTSDSNVSVRFRNITCSVGAGSNGGLKAFEMIRETSKLDVKGHQTNASLELRCLSRIDIDFIRPSADANLVISTVRLAGGTCWLSCVEISGLLGNRGALNVSHGGAILHMLRGRVKGIDGDQDTGHALIYTDGGVGINLYSGVVLIAGDTGSTLCLAPNAGVGSIAINARIFGTILANKAKSSDVTLTVGAITVDADVT